MTYNFKCGTCSETFNVYDKNLVKKDSLICPNCSNKLPDEVFQKLKSAAELLVEVNKNSTKLDGAVTRQNSNHFYYTLQ